MKTPTLRRLASVLLAAAVLSSSCAADPAPSPQPSSTGQVPTTTGRVYLATALACSRLGEFTTRFTPLQVKGSGYDVTVAPTQDCLENEIFSSYVYDVPMPASGPVTLTPGNQPAVELDAAAIAKQKALTVFYGVDNGDTFKVTTIEDGKSESVSEAK